MNKTLLRLKNIIFLLLFFVSSGAFADVSGTAENYSVDESTGDITITGDGVTVSGNVSGNIIIKNNVDGADFTITFDNVQTLSTDKKWQSSVIVYNTGGKGLNSKAIPLFTIKLIGINAFVNSSAPGFIFNPKDRFPTEDVNRQPCLVRFATPDQQGVLYIGSNNSNYKALYDAKAVETETTLRAVQQSYPDIFTEEYIKNAVDNASSSIDVIQSIYKIDDLNYATSTTTPEEGPRWTLKEQTGTDDDFAKFIAGCKSTFQFVKFTMNPRTDLRTAESEWITACYPYNCTVSNGEVYDVFGKVMYNVQADIPKDQDGKYEYEVGELKHLILIRRGYKSTAQGYGEDETEADAYKLKAGHPYFIKRTGTSSNDGKIAITIDADIPATEETTAIKNIHTDPVDVRGFIGTYDKTNLGKDTYFLHGNQMLQVGNFECYTNGYRAYFPYNGADSDNNPVYLNKIDEYRIEDHKNNFYLYRIYKRSDGTGGYDVVETKVKDISGLVILGQEETTAIMNQLQERKESSSQYYDLQGRIVKSPKKGSLYITNGQKVIY